MASIGCWILHHIPHLAFYLVLFLFPFLCFIVTIMICIITWSTHLHPQKGDSNIEACCSLQCLSPNQVGRKKSCAIFPTKPTLKIKKINRYLKGMYGHLTICISVSYVHVLEERYPLVIYILFSTKTKMNLDD